MEYPKDILNFNIESLRTNQSLRISHEECVGFHNDLTLSENYHFIVKKNNIKEIYIMIPSTSRNFLKLKYKSGNHVYQMFNKDRNGF